MRILLVDDYPDALETWSLFLHLKGYEVVTAQDGRTAVDLAISEHPHVIVMDLDLPVLSGSEAARLLRERADTSGIPLIAATGYSHGSQLDEARRAGFDSVMVKPCDPDELVAEISRLTGRAGPAGQPRTEVG
jgi:two-component system CheB/CheR fusion protein